MHRRGFALIELLIVIGILGTVAGMSVPMYNSYQIRNDLNLATEQVVQGLARARLLAQSAQDDSEWGFYIPAGVLYKGTSYADRDPALDEVYPMPSTIKTTGLLEVSYSKLNGRPSAMGDITLTALNDDERTIYIKVEQEAVPVVVNDEITICHYPPGNPGNPHEITISESAWPAHHDNHGDTLGSCPPSSSGMSSASSLSSAAQSSAPQVSSAASSAGGTGGGGGGGETCEDRFSVAADGTITTTGPLSVRFDSLGSQFGYGNGGPDVPVTVSYRKKNSGSWTKLFGGDEINGTGGATQTVTNFANGDKVYVKFRAYFKKKGWLSYDRSITTTDSSKAVMILRNGDVAPTIPGSNGQEDVSVLLAPITTNGIITIGTYDVALIADFNRPDCNYCADNYCSNCTGVDYQDGIVLVKFLTPSC